MAQVRGPSYLSDRKKVPADEPLFALAAVDLIELDAPTFHIARFLPSFKCARALHAPALRPFPLPVAASRQLGAVAKLALLLRQSGGCCGIQPAWQHLTDACCFGSLMLCECLLSAQCDACRAMLAWAYSALSWLAMSLIMLGATPAGRARHRSRTS